jgi:hypothetical protein
MMWHASIDSQLYLVKGVELFAEHLPAHILYRLLPEVRQIIVGF